MHISSINILLLITVLAFSTLYAPQLILPLLAQEFSVSGSEVSQPISLTLFLLAAVTLSVDCNSFYYAGNWRIFGAA